MTKNLPKNMPTSASAILKYLADKPDLPWTDVADLLKRLEQAGFPEQYNGPGNWVDHVVECSGLRKASVWRYRSMARDYPWLQQQLHAAGLPCPELPELDPAVGAEKLEILIKVIKASEAEIWRPIASQLLANQLSLRAIRQIWGVYRPVTEGRNARRRGSLGFAETVDIDETDCEVTKRRKQARFHQALQNQVPRWLPGPVQRLAFYPLVPPVQIMPADYDSVEQKLASLTLNFNALATFQMQGDDMARLHGFIFHTLPGEPELDWLSTQQQCVDQVWVVSTHPLSALPPNVGQIVCPDGEMISVTPPAVSEPTLSVEMLLTLRWLLTQTMPPYNRPDPKGD